MRRTKKPRKHRGGNCLDRISSLPDDILGHILSFLPTRCAVSTSILSTRWRHLFMLTTCLSFDDAPCFDHLKENERVKATRRFKGFVDKVLGSHQISPIKKFSLVCQATFDGSDLNRWFADALRKGVQEFSYRLGRKNFCKLDHDGFFMCETLVSLKMIGGAYHKIKVPLSASLPKLKILHLGKVLFFDFYSIERLFSSCEFLEELTLSYCACLCKTVCHVNSCSRTLKVLTIEHCSFYEGTFEIDAPNLAYLTYSCNEGVKIIPSWKYSCSLVKAELIFMGNNESLVHCELDLLKATAYEVAELQFEMDSTELLLTLDGDKQMPDFPNLSRLRIGACSCNAWKHVIRLIDRSPQLKTVVFDSGFLCCTNSYRCSDHCCGGLLPPSDIPLDPFSCCADVIEVHDFCGDKGPLLLMGHLLRNASLLKSLIISTVCDIDLEEELRICKELLMLPRVSRDSCLKMNKGNKNISLIRIPCQRLRRLTNLVGTV